jgi:hypothetical protein
VSYMWEYLLAPYYPFGLVKKPLDLSGGFMGLVMEFVGLPCWGPIIIGNLILQLLFGVSPMMKTYGLLGSVDSVFPSICFARSFITLPNPLSPCCALHSLFLHFCTPSPFSSLHLQ